MKRLKNKLAVTIIVLSVTFLALIIFTFKDSNKNIIESGAGAALNPIQKIAYTVNTKVKDFVDLCLNFSTVREENRELTKENADLKKTLLKYCDILKIYNCNNKVFKPIASTKCIICVFIKSKTKKFKTEIIDYSNDGHIIKNNKRIKKTEPTIKSYKNILDYKDDWNYQNIRNNNIILPNVKFIFYTLFKNEHSIRFNKYMIEKDYSKLSKECEYFKDKVDSLENIKFKEWVEIKISDYFDFVDVENTFEIKKSSL